MLRALEINSKIDTLPSLSNAGSFGTTGQVEVIVIGTSGSDFLNGTARNDYIAGFESNDILFGNEGEDTLDGGTGDDYLLGGNGNDVYYIDSSNDVALDSLESSGGTDFVYTTTNYTLANNSGIEHLSAFSLEATGFLFLTGANGFETLTGNDGFNILFGMAGNDALYGRGGNDILEGREGADKLDGGLGADNMTGGLNNDEYYVDNAGDTINEGAGEGIDTVATSVSHTLAANVENVVAEEGFLVASLVGNNLNNFIRGNAQSNSLTGGGGSDTFRFGVGGSTVKADTITDFAPSDFIMLKAAQLDDQTKLLPGQFVYGTTAVGTASQVIYDTSTGSLYFDKDGTGAAAKVLFANLQNHALININNFLVDP